ncbi:flagellar hook-associated protein FlgK [Bradyrhizobium sp. AUGA SZCCT0240]|uniref:flagellar hook-associated protein FlgK n=1 Tax=unclassified Bradyrhizobium TaxID=2631580 RepID=UPI001BAC7E59|nr:MULTISPECIES: flagellar hook-associated protein FlgK [unclassified Bradyrhizobium]MBR1199170.1 flagellar hook-associated protein FlgK [Bradyrhizobium sp. AUGA SZCCT0158]MBR1244873.1 flagellar hook-associated protein FlgK [Bradyrhizobium sp. AUGA SZCCT0274]MBR1249370.1 flagellar hook-associated protein FlgK [Bradyrhizobium sp. AUGA SZCCT0169]MBR1253548.1 flagellar hook-associated protein FlgK [Bradyrhizobium sp. AUGA SZCCT0240]
MGLSQALSTAMSGLRATQASLALVSSNVANAETPGYVKKTLNQVAGTTGEFGSSVLINGVNRQLDQYLQTQLRTENSGASYSTIRSTYLANLQNVYGNPDESGTIENAFNTLLTAMQNLSTSPDSQSARIGAVAAAQAMAQQLNSTTQGIQNLRANAENGINDSVITANNAMARIAAINVQLQNNGQTDASTASLLDQRDQYIDQLSQLIDIRTVTNNLNQVTIFTNSGVQLVGTEASQLSFNPQGTMTPNTLYSTDPTKNNVGTITINFPHGGSYDMVSTNSIRSGKIAAYLELRDKTLVQAQAQIDQFAASMSSALSDKTTAGTAAPGSVAPQAGFDLDLAGLQSGNVIHVTYKNNITGVTHNLSIMRVDDPGVLPLTNAATLDPNDEVLGVDFSAGMGSVISQLNAALGATADLQFSNPSGSVLRVLDDGAPNRSDVTAASVTTTMTSLTSGNVQLPLFTDNGAPYGGAITANGSQQIGLAARISVNTALLGDPSRTIVYSTNPLTAAGDTARSDFILTQLSSGSYRYSPATGIGTTGAPFTGTLTNFARQFISQQGEAANAAKQLADGQNVVLNTLQNKVSATSGVNIDDEMAHLLALQNAYSANARVMSSIKQMYDTLIQSM